MTASEDRLVTYPQTLINGRSIALEAIEIARSGTFGGRAETRATLRYPADEPLPDLFDEVTIARRMNLYPSGSWRRLWARLRRRPLMQDYAMAFLIVERVDLMSREIWLREPLSEFSNLIENDSFESNTTGWSFRPRDGSDGL